jgi:hypothetical protein
MIIKLGTQYSRKFLMVLSSDHITGATGKTVTVNISKGAGGAFGAAAGSVAEIANGWYQISLIGADTSTAGDLAYNCTASGCDPTDFVDQVQSQVFTDLALGSGGRVLVASNLQQNSTFSALFFMTLTGTSNAAPGLTVTGQRTFGVGGFSPVSGLIAEVGGVGNGAGWYVFSGLAADSNNQVAGFRMSAATANDTDFTLWFQP